jgi:hypothetical protein
MRALSKSYGWWSKNRVWAVFWAYFEGFLQSTKGFIFQGVLRGFLRVYGYVYCFGGLSVLLGSEWSWDRVSAFHACNYTKCSYSCKQPEAEPQHFIQFHSGTVLRPGTARSVVTAVNSIGLFFGCTVSFKRNLVILEFFFTSLKKWQKDTLLAFGVKMKFKLEFEAYSENQVTENRKNMQTKSDKKRKMHIYTHLYI